MDRQTVAETAVQRTVAGHWADRKSSAVVRRRTSRRLTNDPYLVLYCTILYCIVLYCTVLYCTVLYCTVLCCTVLYGTVLYCIVLYCTVLYCTVL